MKGKNIFTKHEVNIIRELLIKKVNSTTNEQKRIRNKIRKLGFYITDYTNKKGFTVDDFNDLIKDEKVRVK
jgi:hypothetical protein